MLIEKTEIAQIIEEVIKRVNFNKEDYSLKFIEETGICSSVDEAVKKAEIAQKTLMNLSLKKRKDIIAKIKEVAYSSVELFSKMAVEETGLGKIKDKIAKNILAIEKTPGPEDLESAAYSGDNGLTLVEYAPFGIIGSITPSTNSSSTIINNAISMISSGNSVVFNPHPGAKKVSLKVIEVLNQAIQSAGGPVNLITAVSSPSIETSQALMQHPKINLLVVTGGPGVVKQAMSSGKKVIAAGPGNPPVLVDETADIPKAARDIVFGASFDNNIMCIAEKEVFVVEKVLRNLKEQMQLQGAFELNKFQLERLTKLIFKDYGSGCSESVLNRDYIGKAPQIIAKAIDLNLPINTCLLIAEVDFEHPLVSSEQLMPILPIVSVKDVNQGIELAVLAEQGFLHTAVMHSRNVENLSKMAYQIKTTIFVKNAPSLAGLGYGGEGFTSLTIAGPTGEGITSARSFTRIRRCVLADYFRII